MPSVQQHHELALYRRHSLAAAGLVLLCYKRLSLLRMMARAGYRGEDECRPSEDPDGRGHLSTGLGGRGWQTPYSRHLPWA